MSTVKATQFKSRTVRTRASSTRCAQLRRIERPSDQDTPQARGNLHKVRHLVRVEES